MFRLDSAPVFGQQRPELYDEVFSGIYRDTASATDVLEAIRDFLDSKVPHYFESAVNPRLAVEMGVANCIGRSLLVHTLTAPFTQLEPHIEFRKSAYGLHGRNHIVYGQGSSVALLDNSYIEEPYIPGHLSKKDCVHMATTSLAWGMNPALPLDYEVRQQIEHALLNETDQESVVTQEFEQLVKMPSRDDVMTFLLLGRSAGNLLIDAISGAVRSEDHHTIIQNFKAYCTSGVSA